MSDDERLKSLLRQALPPVHDEGPRRDLWPDTLRRIESHAAAMTWVDWAVAAGAALWVLAFPAALPGLLYHL
jgi:hypothetical protein